MTDFFGGVSSVEVMRKEGMLPVLGRKVGKWEEVGKRKEIGGEGASTGWEVSSGNRTERTMSAGTGWARPLVTERRTWRGLQGGAALVALAFATYTWAGRDVKLKTS